jgi:RNA polymerase sigma-70 factor (ECF subfamily)
MGERLFWHPATTTVTFSGDCRSDWTAAWKLGRAAWPGVDLPQEAFSEHLSAIRPDPPASSDPAAGLHVGDLYLACACGRGIPAALLALEREHIRHVPRFIRKTTSDPQIADEVTQALRSKLLLADGRRPVILEYGGRGSLGAWIRVTAIRMAQTMLRRRDPMVAVAPEVLDGALGSSGDPELGLLRSKFGPEASSAVREAISSLTAIQRNVLRLHYFDQLSFERMGVLFGVNRATACRWVAEARRAVIADTRRRLRERLLLRESELDAVTRLLHSQIDVSLSGIFRAG